MSHQITSQIALHLQQVYFGGNWTTSNFKDQLVDVSWQEANFALKEGNSIVTLLFHCNYYIAGLIPVLQGGTLEIKDKFSFDSPKITCEADWEQLKNKSWDEVQLFALIAPTEVVLKKPSEIGNQLTPMSCVFHKPPPVVPI